MAHLKGHLPPSLDSSALPVLPLAENISFPGGPQDSWVLLGQRHASSFNNPATDSIQIGSVSAGSEDLARKRLTSRSIPHGLRNDLMIHRSLFLVGCKERHNISSEDDIRCSLHPDRQNAITFHHGITRYGMPACIISDLMGKFGLLGWSA